MNKVLCGLIITGMMTVFLPLLKSEDIRNLIQNYQLRSSNNNIPDGWSWFLDRTVIRVIPDTETNIVEISEDTDKYVFSISNFVRIDGFKTYKLSVEIKVENISKNAAVYYYWTDANGKEITKERFLTKLSGTKDWEKKEQIISPENPSEIKGIRIILAVYGVKGGAGKAWFRNPCLTEAEPEKKKLQ
ncbi:MAG: hypothetical protein NC931_00725 [Candidatus Omnitrophica bacterium]|nr:hypothetical protein [Candidatus Omnitrophota bacterium]